MSLIPVKETEIELGKPLPWDLFDPQHNLLVARGVSIDTADQLPLIFACKPCRELSWDAETRESAPDELTAEQITGAASVGDAGQSSFPFDTMKLKVGDRLQIQPPALLSPERFIVKLIGFVHNVSLLVTAPVDTKGMRLQLVEGEELVVRVFSSQNAFGFPCSVRKVQRLPFDYLHLSYPAEVQGMMIRKSPRVRTRIIAAIGTGKPGEDSTPAVISNLSANGALLDAKQNLAEKGATIRLSFRINLHDLDAYLTVSAAIRTMFGDNVLEGERSGLIHHGLEFVNLSPNDKVILQSMIYQQMIEQPHTLA